MSTQKKRHISKLLLAIIIAIGAFAIVGLFQYLEENSSITVDNTATSTIEVIEEQEDTSYLDEIRSREDIQRQQELLVMETYLNEEKDRIENEKSIAIDSYDNQLSELEVRLEEVRGEKLSFQ